jgi:hypothetical protein
MFLKEKHNHTKKKESATDDKLHSKSIAKS